MAASGGSRRGGASRGTPRRPAGASAGARKPAPKRPRSAPRPEPVVDETPRVLTLGAVPGATPGTWIGRWRERVPHVELVLVSIPVARQREELAAGTVDLALVRMPLAGDDLHVIPLYEEATVAVVPADSHLTAADELDLADLSGEVLIVPGDDVLGADVPGALAPSFAPPPDTEDAIATVGAGVGVVLVPMSIARLHARKDVEQRVVRDAPISRMALAWPREKTTPDVETFVGIVRGRTANSSR